MIRLPEILSIQKEGGIHDNACVWLCYTPQFRDGFMKAIQVLEDMGAIDFIKSIFTERIGEGINIVNHVTTMINDIEVYVSLLEIKSTSEIQFLEHSGVLLFCGENQTGNVSFGGHF